MNDRSFSRTPLDSAGIILGMHRSGTSCLTGSLQNAGLHLGDVHTANPHNEKGNRESPLAMEVNEELLELNGNSWDKPAHPQKSSIALIKKRDHFLQELIAPGSSPVGFKDPRCTFTLPFWLSAIRKPVLLASFRHPMLVAQSLAARNRFSIEEGLALWKKYNIALLELAKKNTVTLVNFDLSADDYAKDLIRCVDALGLKQALEAPDILSFYSENLRHQATPQNHTLDAEALMVYQQLQDFHIGQRS